MSLGASPRTGAATRFLCKEGRIAARTGRSFRPVLSERRGCLAFCAFAGCCRLTHIGACLDPDPGRAVRELAGDQRLKAGAEDGFIHFPSIDSVDGGGGCAGILMDEHMGELRHLSPGLTAVQGIVVGIAVWSGADIILPYHRPVLQGIIPAACLHCVIVPTGLLAVAVQIICPP